MNAVWRVASALGIVASSLSLLLLAKQGFDLGFVAPLKLMLDFYQQAVEFLLGWADAPLKDVLRYIGDWMGVDLHLYPHWKHIFMPMWLFFSANAKVNWGRGRKRTTLFTMIWGSLVALAASVASGTVALDDPNMFPVIFPVVGFVVYDAVHSTWDAIFHNPPGYTSWQSFNYYQSRFTLSNAIIGSVVIFVGLLARRMGLPTSNLVLVIIYVIALAMRRIMGKRMACSLRPLRRANLDAPFPRSRRSTSRFSHSTSSGWCRPVYRPECRPQAGRAVSFPPSSSCERRGCPAASRKASFGQNRRSEMLFGVTQ